MYCGQSGYFLNKPRILHEDTHLCLKVFRNNDETVEKTEDIAETIEIAKPLNLYIYFITIRFRQHN